METANAIQIYNSQTHRLEQLKPRKPGEVSIYVCGATVYDYMHIGNARPLVVFDLLRRLLRHEGYRVRYAMNFTDIDDKIIRRANREGCPFEEIAERYIQAYIEDREALAVEAPDEAPRASESLKQIISMIESLLEQGYAYIGTEGVYFDVSKHEGYGKLARLNQETLESGRRELVYRAEDKRHSADFALWKFKREGEPAFPAPFGEGRPGWHIECSAMIRDLFGGGIDIHAGGQDLIFPHHENEIAQSECCYHEELARYWMHNAYITFVDAAGSEKKMSKSLGNSSYVRDLGTRYGYDVLRFFILSAQYRSNLKFYPGALEEAGAALERLYEGLRRLRFLRQNPRGGEGFADETLAEKADACVDRFYQALREDLNTPAAVAELFVLSKAFHQADREGAWTPTSLEACERAFSEMLRFLGLMPEEDKGPGETVEELLAQRQAARARRDFAEADRLRDLIKEQGYLIKDTPQGAQLEKR